MDTSTQGPKILTMWTNHQTKYRVSWRRNKQLLLNSKRILHFMYCVDKDWFSKSSQFSLDIKAWDISTGLRHRCREVANGLLGGNDQSSEGKELKRWLGTKTVVWQNPTRRIFVRCILIFCAEGVLEFLALVHSKRWKKFWEGFRTDLLISESSYQQSVCRHFSSAFIFVDSYIDKMLYFQQA